jgi:hypothetical protein
VEHDPNLSPTAQVPTFDPIDEPARWPTVVGTISIVWASLNLLCAGCGVLSPVLMSTLMKSAEAQLGPMPDVMRPGAGQVVVAGLGFVWAILLLVAGIMLTLRKPAARMLHLVYAAGAIVLSIAGTAVAVMMQLRIAEWVADNPDSPWAQQQNPAVSFAMIGVSVVLGMAWPVFVLVWFGVVKRNASAIVGSESAVV